MHHKKSKCLIYDRKFLIQIEDVSIMLSYKYLTLFQMYFKKLKIMFYKLFLQLIFITLCFNAFISYKWEEMLSTFVPELGRRWLTQRLARCCCLWNFDIVIQVQVNSLNGYFQSRWWPVTTLCRAVPRVRHQI